MDAKRLRGKEGRLWPLYRDDELLVSLRVCWSELRRDRLNLGKELEDIQRQVARIRQDLGQPLDLPKAVSLGEEVERLLARAKVVSGQHALLRAAESQARAAFQLQVQPLLDSIEPPPGPVACESPVPEPTAPQPDASALSAFARAAHSYFPDFVTRHSVHVPQLEAVLDTLASIYLREGRIESVHLREFRKRCYYASTNAHMGHTGLYRIGLVSRRTFQLLLDVSDPVRPRLLFVGHRERMDHFVSQLLLKHNLEAERSKADADGRSALFSRLRPDLSQDG